MKKALMYKSEILGLLLTLAGTAGFLAMLFQPDLSSVYLYVSLAFAALGVFVVGGMQLQRLKVGNMTATFDEEVAKQVKETCPCEFDAQEVVDKIEQSDVSSIVVHK